MSKIVVKVNGEWTDDPGALSASLAAMTNKDELQTKLIAALESEIARLRAALKVIDECFADMKTRLEEHLLPGPPGPEPVAWRYKGEPWFDGSRWHDKYELTTDERLAKWKDKDALPLAVAGVKVKGESNG